MTSTRIVLNNTGLYPADDYMSLDIFRPDFHDPEKIAFVFHGRNGCSNSYHLLKMIEPYLKKNYIVIAPNICHSNFNDSAGTGESFLIAHHVRDCARTIEWAKSSCGILGWNSKEIALCGHSMGGYAAAFLAATTYNDCTSHVLAVSPFTDGDRHINTRLNRNYHPGGIEALQADCPNALTEWRQHSIYKVIKNLRMPVSAVVGINDTLTLPSDIADFFDDLPHGVDILILQNEHHCLVGENIPSILEECITKLEDFTQRRLFPVYAVPHGPSL